MAPVPYLVAMHPDNNGVSPANETGVPVLGGTHACANVRRAEWGESGGTTAVSTQGVEAIRDYLNKQLSKGGKWYSHRLGILILMSSSLGVHG